MSGAAIVQRGPHSFAVVCYSGIDPRTNKQRQKKFGGFKTRRDSELYRARLMHHPLYSAGVGPDGRRTLRLERYLFDWIDERATLGRLRPHTASDYRDLTRLHIAPALGHVPLHRLSAAALSALYVDLLKSGRSAGTVRKVAAVIHAGLRAAVRANLIMRSPADTVTLPPLEHKQKKALWTPAQLRLYLDDARETATPAEYAVYVLQAGAGARIGEITGAADNAVDLAVGVLNIERTLVQAGREAIFAPPKTDAGERTVLLPAEGLVAVRAAALWKKQQRLRLAAAFHDGGTLFCTPTGRPIDRHALRARDHVPRIKRLGLPYIRPHDFRHLNASYMVAAGVDDVAAAARLGHADPGYMKRTYAHPVVQAQTAAARVGNELVTNSGRFAVSTERGNP